MSKAPADFNGDGKADILWQNDNGQPAIWLMDGTNVTFVRRRRPVIPGRPGTSKARGDFNGDGKADILWQNDNGTPAIWPMDGTNITFVGAVGSSIRGPPGMSKARGDFNGDGKADILWQNDNGKPAIWPMDGTNVTSWRRRPANPGPTWHVGRGRFQRRRQGRYSLAERQRHAGVWPMDGTNATVVSTVGPFNPGATWDMIA